MHFLVYYDSECLVYVLICILFIVREEHFLGVFADFRKAAVSFILSVCPSAWNLAPTGRIFMKIYI